MSQGKRKAANGEDGTNKRLHALMCICVFMLLNWSTPTLAASGAHIVQTHSHPNEPTTYQAQLPGDAYYGQASSNALPPTVQTTKAIVQRLAPEFEAEAVVGGEFKTIKLSDYKGKYVVLLFYPLDFTFVCPTELIAFGDRLNEFQAIGAEVIAVSVDSKFAHLAWTNQPRDQGGLGKIALPLVSDITKSIARDYGVLVTEGPDAGVSLRGLFIISEKGIVRQATMNDLPVGRSVDETLRLVKAFQYTDTHDVVCPAGWTPGSDVMKATPAESLAYFQKQHGKN